MALGRMKNDVSVICDRLWDTYELSYAGAMEQLMAYPQPEKPFKESEAEGEAQKIRDRIRSMGPVNVAAIEEYGAPLIILDFGTATTFCVVNEKGEYLGGAIAPGVGISLNALVERTAQLPKVEMVVPDKVIGKTTVHAIQSGLLYGYCGMVDGMVRRIAAELALPLDQVKVIATGGLAEVIHANTETIQIIDQMLTLKGLLLLYNRNEKLHSGSEGGRKEAGEA
jgi:hypothetical protein